MLRSITLSLTVLLLISASAQAGNVLQPYRPGSTEAHDFKMPGESFTIDFVLNCDPNDVSTSAIFDVTFSQPGLQYDSYSWTTPYETGGIDDWSDTSVQTGIITSGEALTGNLYFENFADGEHQGNLLLSLTLTVPGDYPHGTVIIRAIPDTFANDLGDLTIEQGSNFYLHVPEPTTLTLLGLGLAGLLRRRR